MRCPFHPPSTKNFMSKKNVVCAQRGHGNCPVVFGLCQNGGVPAASMSVPASAVIVVVANKKKREKKNAKRKKAESRERKKKKTANKTTHNVY